MVGSVLTTGNPVDSRLDGRAHTITPDGSEVVVRDGTAQTGGVSFTLSSGAGNYVALLFDGTRWVTLGYKGTLAEGS